MKIVPYPIRIINNYRLSISLSCALNSLPVESTLLPIDLVFRLICSTQLKSRSDRQIPFDPLCLKWIDACGLWILLRKTAGKRETGDDDDGGGVEHSMSAWKCFNVSLAQTGALSLSLSLTHKHIALADCLAVSFAYYYYFCTRSAAELIMSLAAQLVADDNKDMPQVGRRERERDSLDGATIAEQCL